MNLPISLDTDALPLRPQLIEYERPKTAPAVTQDEIRATEHTIERLQFEMATMVRDDHVVSHSTGAGRIFVWGRGHPADATQPCISCTHV